MIPWHLPIPPMSAQVAAMEKIDKIEWETGRHSGALFADPGLGKTWDAFNLILDRFKKGQARSATIVAPSYLITNWENEAKLLGLDQEFNIGIYPRRPNPTRPHPVCVTYYQRMQTDDWNQSPFQIDAQSVLVWDECHAMKNYQSKTARLGMELSKETPFVYPMTGTPMEKVTDYWPQLRIAKGISGISPVAFRNRYARMGGYKGKEVIGIRNEDELRKIIDSCAFEAAEEDYWKDAPPKTYTIVNHDLLPAQRKMYEEMEFDRLIELDDSEVSAQMVITMMNKLQQIACGFVIDDKGHAHDIVPLEQNPRIKALRAKLEDTPTKVYVVCVHRRAMEHLRAAFPYAAYMTGGMDPVELQEQKDRFNKDPACRHMVAQESIGKAGHTLIGEPGPNRCRTMLFYQNEYSIITRQQAEKRPHRQGQDMPVEYCDIVATKEDRRVIASLQRKKDIVRAALGRDR